MKRYRASAPEPTSKVRKLAKGKYPDVAGAFEAGRRAKLNSPNTKCSYKDPERSAAWQRGWESAK